MPMLNEPDAFFFEPLFLLLTVKDFTSNAFSPNYGTIIQPAYLAYQTAILRETARRENHVVLVNPMTLIGRVPNRVY